MHDPDEPRPHGAHWLDDRLQSVQGDAPGFGVVRSPLRPVVERTDPWQADLRRHDFGVVLPRLLPEPSEGGARVVAVTDVEEDPVGRVQTAALLARRLVEAERSVLVVDADLRHVGLSRWMPDRDLDAEGLVDVLQYGASVSAVRRPGPIDGVDLVPVGSYRPDGSDIFEDEALGRLVLQLRQQADVVLLVTPAWLPPDRFHPLLVHSDSVVVSMHLDRSLASPLEELLRYLEGLNVPVVGLVTYSGPDASEKQVDQILRETDPDRDHEPGPDADAEVGVDESDESWRPASEESVAKAMAAVESAREQIDRDFEGESDLAPEPPPRGFRRPPREEESSSPVFRIALVAIVVALIGFVGWWGLTQREHPDPRPPRMTRTSGTERPTTSPAPIEANMSASDAGEAEGGVVEEAGDTDLQVAEDETGLGASVREPADTEPAAMDDAGPDGAESPTPSDREQEEGDVEAPAEKVDGSIPSDGDPAPTTDWERAVARAVGGGYALHLYSFSDSTEALTTLPPLRRLGWQPEVRGADIPDKGRWYRVLVGRFDDRSSALAAREAAGERAKVDWVGVVRVP